MDRACAQKGFIQERNQVVEGALSFESSEPEDIATLNDTIEWSQTMVAKRLNRCKDCGGMVLDLATGRIYCGADTPLEVIRSNRKILAS